MKWYIPVKNLTNALSVISVLFDLSCFEVGKFSLCKFIIVMLRSYCINFDTLIYWWTQSWKLSFVAHESNYHTGKPIFPCKICGRNFGVSQALNSMSLIILLLAILSKTNLRQYVEITVIIALVRLPLVFVCRINCLEKHLWYLQTFSVNLNNL